MKFIIPVESIIQNKGGVIEYDPINNKILRQYVHSKKWRRSGWRGGIIHKDYLIATDWQDLHYFNLKKWKYEKSYTQTTFNDLHYLTIYDNRLYVVNTGLDAIEEIRNPMKPEEGPNFLTFVFSKIPEIKKRKIDIWEKWNEKYKTNHVCHPNCITIKKGLKFVTCFENEKRGKKSGKVVELSTQQVVLDKHNCHDGNFYNDDFYLSGTREHQIYVIYELLEQKWPVKIDKKINIGKPGWWRGMVIHNDKAFIFASYAYGENSSCKMAVIDLQDQKTIDIVTLPKHQGVQWDTIYQPNLAGKI